MSVIARRKTTEVLVTKGKYHVPKHVIERQTFLKEYFTDVNINININ